MTDTDEQHRWGPPPDDSPTISTSLVTTTTRTPGQGVGRHAAPVEAAERGTLTVADVVVEKVAVVAAGEVDDVGGSARRVLGIPTGREDGEGRPRVSAHVSGEVVGLDVRLTVAYPAPVRQVTEAVRAHLRDRVHALTELTVTRVDIDVTALTRPAGPSTGRTVA